jgi:hypothetical protein
VLLSLNYCFSRPFLSKFHSVADAPWIGILVFKKHLRQNPDGFFSTRGQNGIHFANAALFSSASVWLAR